MKTILVHTDFSKNSINAIEYATVLAKKEKAKLILLNTYHYMPPTSEIPFPMEVVATMKRESENRLRKLCDEISRSKKIKCESLSQFDFAVPAIIDSAKKKKANLIVMGTQGASGLKRTQEGDGHAEHLDHDEEAKQHDHRHAYFAQAAFLEAVMARLKHSTP